MTQPARQLAGILQAQTESVAAAVPHLAEGAPHDDVRHAVMQLHQLATEAEHELIQALSGLYEGVDDLSAFVQARRWEELYVLLEKATDRTEKIGHTMLRITA